MKLYQLIAVTFLCLTLCACKHCTTASETTQTLTTLNIPNSELQRFEYTEPHMGMLFYIIFYLDDKDRADQIAEKAFERVEQLNTIMSDYIPNSELNHLTDAPKGSEIPLSDDLFEVLSISKKLYKASSGAFDPIFGGNAAKRARFPRRRKSRKLCPAPDATSSFSTKREKPPF